MPTPFLAIRLDPATGDEVAYWTKIRSVGLYFFQSYNGVTTYPSDYVNTPPHVFSGSTEFTGTAQNIIGDPVDDDLGPRHGSFGMKGGCFLGPMMTGTSFDFVCRGNGSIISASSANLDQNYTRPIYVYGGKFVRNYLDSPPLTGISAPWYITTWGISVSSPNDRLIVPWSDFDRGGSFSHEWGETGTKTSHEITTITTISGNFTITLEV